MAIPINRALDLLDQHLYGNLSSKASAEALQGIDDAYRQLTYRPEPVVYYRGKQLEGTISPQGGVEFQRNYPELGTKSYYSPEELIIANNGGWYTPNDRFGNGFLTDPESAIARGEVLETIAKQPAPTRELVQMSRAFNDYSNSPEGARLYYNTPASEHRAKAYRKQGFEDIPNEEEVRQYLDKRPLFNNDINNLYAFGDASNLGSDAAIVLHRQRLRNNGLNVLPAPMEVIRKALPSSNSYRQDLFDDYDDIAF